MWKTNRGTTQMIFQDKKQRSTEEEEGHFPGAPGPFGKSVALLLPALPFSLLPSFLSPSIRRHPSSLTFSLPSLPPPSSLSHSTLLSPSPIPLPSILVSFPPSFPLYIFSVPAGVFILMKLSCCGHADSEVVIIHGRTILTKM